MKKFKAIELVKAFPKRGIHFLSDFLEKNASSEVAHLMQYALNEYQDGESDQQIWSRLYPSEPFNKQRFANHCHQLLNSVEQAICKYSLKEKDLRYYDILLPALLEWDLLDHYQFTRQKAQRMLSKQGSQQNASYHEHRLDYLHFVALEKESSRKTDLNITEASASLDEYYLLLKLRYLCAAQSHQNISSANYEVRFIEDLLPTMVNSKLGEHPLIKNYILVYKLLKETDEDAHFQSLKTQLIKDRELFSDQELNEIYIYPINYCVQKINQGSLSHRQELLSIYKSLPGFAIDSNEIISPWRFRNVVQLAVISDDLDWADFFIQNYSHRLLNEYQENAVNYNMANLRFHQKRYDEVIQLLINVEFIDVNYALICKILLLKTYYEMKELDAFYSLLESFRLYILRSRELSGVQRKQYLDLLSILRQLNKKEYASREVVEKFKTKIRNRKIIADKAWILEQLEAL